MTSATYHSWDSYEHHSLFPTSNLRSSPLSPPHTTAPYLPQPSQSTASSSSKTLYHDLLITQYTVPERKEIEPGVWSNGTDRVLSAAYPAVQDFLATARRTLCLPLPPSELVFVISALEVFYSWNDPVHWLFWSDEKKAITASVVNRIALRTPQLIRSKVAWNGESEYLFILSGLHGSSSLPTDKDWFHVLNPSKTLSSAPMNLRKRKIQPAEQIELNETPCEEDGSEIEGSRPKRPKTRSARLVKPSNPVTPEHTSTAVEVILFDESSTSSSVSSKLSNVDTSLPAKSKDSLEKSNKRQTSQGAPDPLTMSLPRATSAPLGPTVDHSKAAPSYTRNRSTSQASSQTTLVADERRSVSVLSNNTAVEVRGDSDAIKVDQPMSDPEEGDANGEEKEGMVTRGRASKTRAAIVQVQAVARPTKPRAKKRSTK